jgi:LysM repeat protein
MLKRIICILVLVFSVSAFSQTYIKHTVVKGETLNQIAQKYKVTPYDIIKLNPDSQNGIKPDKVLIIPQSIARNANNQVVVASSTKTHEVKAKETLYSISKLYNVSIEAIQKNNPFLATDGLQPGQKLVISSKTIPSDKPENTVKPVVTSSATIHEIMPKETKYGIAKKYGMSVEELEQLNPEIKDSFPIGFKLKVKKVTNSSHNEVVENKPEPAKQELFNYTVKQGETLYSLTRLLGISEEKLKVLNPELVDGLKDGMVLKVPANLTLHNDVKNVNSNLANSISKGDRKKLVMLLPFNVAKFESDTLNSVASKLKKDKFLNMTLDFYSGALIAIDSANTLGINVDVSIFDSNETKYSTDAINIVNEKAPNANAVIGPFFQNNAEKLAEALQEKNIPVISPLSKEYEKSFPNLYQSLPTLNAQRDAIFEYMHAKNGNILAVVDPKKTSSLEYIKEFQKDAKLVGFSDKGGFVGDSIRKLFVKDKINYVILESEREGTVFTTTSVMLGAMKDYKVQLVILEPNATLEYEEIALSKLTKLNLLYPSANKDNNSELGSQFDMAYKKKNKVLPNAFAMRGFDVTFDTLLRLAQDKSFEETMTTATQQIENKFDYTKTVSGGYINKGIYILYYDTDLMVKEAQ